jgi:sister chromatid cohesion protein PDS5
MVLKDENLQLRKLFIGKVHQYIKERVLDAKYACSFLLNISKYHSPEYEEVSTHSSIFSLVWLYAFCLNSFLLLTKFVFYLFLLCFQFFGRQCKHNLHEVVQICQQVKMRQLSLQADMNLLVAYPEYILAYLIHALAHDPSCPKFEEGVEINVFGPTYWYVN